MRRTQKEKAQKHGNALHLNEKETPRPAFGGQTENFNLKTHYLEIALEEVKRLVSEGFLSGGNSNTTGNFHFDINGSAVDHYRFLRKGKLLKKKYTNYDDAMHDPAVKDDDQLFMFGESGYELGPCA